MSIIKTLTVAVVVSFAMLGNSHGRDLSSDETQSCTALLCLASATRPSECNSALAQYFSIKRLKLKDTLNARRSFLKICPTANENSQVAALADAISKGAGQCDAATLNRQLEFTFDVPGTWGKADETGHWVTAIKDEMPSLCNDYYDFFAPDYFRTDKPRYVGTIGVNGRWED